jgi:sodium/proline symporter
MLLLGLCGRILLPELGDPEVVFITMTTHLFHPVLAGVMLAAVLSAIMSTADSQLLVASSTVSHDLWFVKRSSGSILTQSRVVVFLISAGAVLAAIFGTREIFSQVLFAWAAMGSAFGPLLLIESIKGPIEPKTKLAAMVTGFVLSVCAFYVFPADFSWKGAFERVFPVVVVLSMAIAGYLRMRGQGPEIRN